MAPPLLLLILENRILLFFSYVEHLLVILFVLSILATTFLKVGRIKQKRGYKDQWPWNIKIYTDDSGKAKGDACLAYEDPSAAHSAGGFYNGMFSAVVAAMHHIVLFDTVCFPLHNAYTLLPFQIMT